MKQAGQKIRHGLTLTGRSRLADMFPACFCIRTRTPLAMRSSASHSPRHNLSGVLGSVRTAKGHVKYTLAVSVLLIGHGQAEERCWAAHLTVPVPGHRHAGEGPFSCELCNPTAKRAVPHMHTEAQASVFAHRAWAAK
jgi:hypothetical protein